MTQPLHGASILRLAAPKNPRPPLADDIQALAEQIQARRAAHPLMVQAITQYVACFPSGAGPTEGHAVAAPPVVRRRMCRATLP